MARGQHDDLFEINWIKKKKKQDNNNNVLLVMYKMFTPKNV